MKKKLAWLGVLCVLISMLAGCSTPTRDKSMSAVATQVSLDEAKEENIAVDYGYTDNAVAASSTSKALPPSPTNKDAKIIYTADLDVETTDFEAALDSLSQLTSDCGGYYEYSRQNNSGSYRSAEFSIRVPAEKYRDFLTQIGELCHVLNQYENTDDVSEIYYDTAGRLETQQTKLERLQELLSQAKSMEDIITIESAISETEETIDALSGTLRHYDDQVDYSTVTIYLQEVYRLSNVEEPVQGFGSRVSSAFRSGLDGFVVGGENILIALAYGWLWIVLVVAIVVMVVLVICRIRKRHIKKDNVGILHDDPSKTGENRDE